MSQGGLSLLMLVQQSAYSYARLVVLSVLLLCALACQSPSNVETPEPTATPVVQIIVVTATQEPSTYLASKAIDTPIPTASATPLPISTVAPTPTHTPTELPTPTVTATPLVFPTFTPTPTPLPTASPTLTPQPTVTPEPTATVTPVNLEGMLTTYLNCLQSREYGSFITESKLQDYIVVHRDRLQSRYQRYSNDISPEYAVDHFTTYAILRGCNPNAQTHSASTVTPVFDWSNNFGALTLEYAYCLSARASEAGITETEARDQADLILQSARHFADNDIDEAKRYLALIGALSGCWMVFDPPYDPDPIATISALAGSVLNPPTFEATPTAVPLYNPNTDVETGKNKLLECFRARASDYYPREYMDEYHSSLAQRLIGMNDDEAQFELAGLGALHLCWIIEFGADLHIRPVYPETPDWDWTTDFDEGLKIVTDCLTARAEPYKYSQANPLRAVFLQWIPEYTEYWIDWIKHDREQDEDTGYFLLVEVGLLHACWRVSPS